MQTYEEARIEVVELDEDIITASDVVNETDAYGNVDEDGDWVVDPEAQE